jgi:2-C-methyl-D-erythritol 4-phosphate cytidylyltransferase
MTIWAILPAAGIGRRMGSDTPKQYLEVNGTAVVALTLQRLASIPRLEKIIVVLHPDDCHWQSLELALDPRIETASGGAERFHSVLNGLRQLDQAKADDWVLVHDAVRPCVPSVDIETLIDTLQQHPVGGLLGCPLDNTLKQVDAMAQVTATIDRSHFWNALTPQMFRYGLLCEALQRVVDENIAVTDEAGAMELAGLLPQMVAGSRYNIKITHAEDLLLATQILAMQKAGGETTTEGGMP